MVSLTTTGARSGRPRTVLVVPVVTAEVFAVLGTNFGGSSPAWAINLLAHPAATVEFRGHRMTVQAGELDDPVRSSVLIAAAALYPGFARYLRRAAGRRVHVFALIRLRPAPRPSRTCRGIGRRVGRGVGPGIGGTVGGCGPAARPHDEPPAGG